MNKNILNHDFEKGKDINDDECYFICKICKIIIYKSDNETFKCSMGNKNFKRQEILNMSCEEIQIKNLLE